MRDPPDFLQTEVSRILGTVELLLDTHEGNRLMETKAQMCHPAAWHLQLTQVVHAVKVLKTNRCCTLPS